MHHASPAVPDVPRDDEQLVVAVGTPLDEVERLVILATLRRQDDNKRATARVLGISVKTLYNRLRRYRAGELRPAGPAASSPGPVRS